MPRLQQREVDGALSDIERSIELDPTAPEGYYQRAMVRVQTNRVDEGIADAAKAASIDLNYASQHLDLLFSLRKFKEAAMAGALYKEKIPNDYKIHLMTGMALYESEDYLGALDSLNSSEKHLGSFAPARHYRGMSYFKLKRYDEALADLDWCWVVDRGNGRPNPQVIHLVAACRFFLKQYKECLGVLDELVKVDPRMKDHPDVVSFTRECRKALGQ
jgi:tetratricopeptide (TPR) repeat protein